MKPISLYLRGFRGIRDGLGREELVLDLDALAGEAQLVAIQGANGRGKTTVLDNLTPFPTMPSRAGGDGTGAFSYYEHVFLPESIKDLVWEHGGWRYRSQIVIRSSGRRRTEAYLHVRDQSGWVPVGISDGTVSDGKMETYERCLAAILGAERTFFISAFAAQGRRQLCSYRTGEVKALLADLLGLDDIRGRGQRAAEVTKLLRVGLGGLRAELAIARQEMDAARARAQCIPDIDRDLGVIRHRRAGLQAKFEELGTALAALEGERAHAEQNAVEREALRAERVRVEASFARQGKELADDRQREASRLASLQSEQAAQHAEQWRAHAGIVDQRRQAQAAIGDAALIRRSARHLEIRRVIVAGREQRAEHYRQKVMDLRGAENQERALAREIESVERAAGQAALRVADLKQRLALTQTVPCKGLPMQEDCQLLADARAARPIIPSANAELDRLNDTRAGLREQLAQARSRSAGLRAAPVLLSRAESRLVRSRLFAEQAMALAARSGEVVQAEEILRECDERTESLERSIQESHERDIAARQALEMAIAEIDARIARLDTDRSATLDVLARRFALLPPAFDGERLIAGRDAVSSAQGALQASDEALQDLLRQRAVAGEAEAAANRLAERRLHLESRCAIIEQELTVWTIFAKCMGGDGLIALMIDDAGPELSRLSNDLLVACYGHRFTLSIRTQVDTAKGEAREGFEIMVHDGETGQCKSVVQMSGGERVWINDCLTRAIALYVAQCSGRRYETLFSDESDGPLDADRKRMFMRMKREVLRLGGYEREYFISQTPEMAAMADAVIDVDVLLAGRDLPRTS